ncbi:hypothetical protein Tco_0170150 [Tanacetum coccineum]
MEVDTPYSAIDQNRSGSRLDTAYLRVDYGVLGISWNVNEVVKDAEVANSVEDDSIDDFNDLNEVLNNLDHDFKDMENLENAFSVQPDTLMKEENFAQCETQKEEEVCKVHKPNIIDDTSDVSNSLVLNTSSVVPPILVNVPPLSRHHNKA